MQSAQERRRLLRAMHAEPARAWMVLAKCAAGLAAIALIAAIGASDGVDHDVAGNVVPDAAPRSGQTAQAHRTQVFDERRARFAGGAGRHSIASEVLERVNPLPLTLR
jgi:hypothetical protein